MTKMLVSVAFLVLPGLALGSGGTIPKLSQVAAQTDEAVSGSVEVYVLPEATPTFPTDIAAFDSMASVGDVGFALIVKGYQARRVVRKLAATAFLQMKDTSIATLRFRFVFRADGRELGRAYFDAGGCGVVLGDRVCLSERNQFFDTIMPIRLDAPGG
jgi:hypothetical protein